MITLTQEKREELIAHNTEKLKGLKQSVEQTAFESVKEELELEIQSTEITLASLTADSFGYVDRNTFSTEHEYQAILHAPLAGNLMLKGGYDIVALFTAPPVPAIKLPEKLDVGEIHYELTEKYGVDISLDQLERGLADEVYSIAVNTFERLNGLGE